MANAAKAKSPAVKRRRVVLSADLGPGKAVSVAGNFNDWDPNAKPMRDKNNDGVYRCQLRLAPGEYQYKFVVDGQWCLDSTNPNFVPNDIGSLNSVLSVKEK